VTLCYDIDYYGLSYKHSTIVNDETRITRVTIVSDATAWSIILIIIDDITKAKTRANKTLILQVSLMIVTYNCQNIFIVQATVDSVNLFSSLLTFFL